MKKIIILFCFFIGCSINEPIYNCSVEGHKIISKIYLVTNYDTLETGAVCYLITKRKTIEILCCSVCNYIKGINYCEVKDTTKIKLNDIRRESCNYF